MEILTKIYVYLLIWIEVNVESSEDDGSFTNIFNSFSPTSVNFQDIYTNALTLHSEDSPTVTNDDDLPVSSLSTQYVEFHPKTSKLSRITPPSTIPNFSNVKGAISQAKKMQKTGSTACTVPDEITKAVPIKNHQKGVLDVLFPAARVKSFKNVFNSFKRFLSQTLRR